MSGLLGVKVEPSARDALREKIHNLMRIIGVKPTGLDGIAFNEFMRRFEGLTDEKCREALEECHR
jgi:hypothetical protein